MKKGTRENIQKAGKINNTKENTKRSTTTKSSTINNTRKITDRKGNSRKRKENKLRSNKRRRGCLMTIFLLIKLNYRESKGRRSTSKVE